MATKEIEPDSVFSLIREYAPIRTHSVYQTSHLRRELGYGDKEIADLEIALEYKHHIQFGDAGVESCQTAGELLNLVRKTIKEKNGK